MINPANLTKLLLAFLTFLSVACSAQASVLNVNPDRLVKVIDVVDYSILNEAIQIEKLSPVIGKREDIFVMVNSPGGMVEPGLIFTNSIDRAKLRGYKVICFSTVMAASMAFQVLAHCSENYVLQHTKLLFHPVRIGGNGFTQSDLDYYSAEIKVVESLMNKQLQRSFKFDPELFRYHYARETMWEAVTLATFTNHLIVVDDIIGVPESYTYRKERGFFFGQHGLQYIKPETLRVFNLEN